MYTLRSFAEIRIYNIYLFIYLSTITIVRIRILTIVKTIITTIIITIIITIVTAIVIMKIKVVKIKTMIISKKYQ